MQILYAMQRKIDFTKIMMTKLFINTSICNKPNIYHHRPNRWHMLTVDSLKYIPRSVNIKALQNIVGATVSGVVLFSSLPMNLLVLQAATKNEMEKIKESDLLYDQLKFEEIYDLLIVEKGSNNDEILWRLARATYEKARKTDKEGDKKALYAEALHYLEEANELNDSNFAVQKWLAIIKDCYYSMEGMKARISHLYDMKTHMEKACNLKPEDGTSWYVLGLWYYGIANISWYERKVASIFFASPPQASYEDALKMFLEAERVEPDFYRNCHVVLGSEGRLRDLQDCRAER